jgi:hypothetical protein
MPFVASFKDQESIMSGVNDDDEGALSDIPDSPPRERETSYNPSTSNSHLFPKTQELGPKKGLFTADTEMAETQSLGSQLLNDNHEGLLNRQISEDPLLQKHDYPPGYHKYDTVKVFEDNMESNK